jgi:hypothetical protein
VIHGLLKPQSALTSRIKPRSEALSMDEIRRRHPGRHNAFLLGTLNIAEARTKIAANSELGH